MEPRVEEERSGLVVEARTSSDKIKLFVDVHKSDPKLKPARQDLLAALQEIIPIDCIELGVVDDIVRHLRQGATEVLDRRVLIGRLPVSGENGYLVLKIKKISLDEPHKSSPGDSRKFTDLHVFDNVERGEVIGKIYHPKEGEPGRDVYGDIIPCEPARPCEITTDQTIHRKLSKNGSYDLLIALEAGCLTEQRGVLSISPRLNVSSDVDFHWGNINFIGEVRISGDVMPGFNVKARKGIEIQGSVRGGSLISTEGAVTVSDYVFGGPGSMILAGKSFSASLVQEVNTEIIGDIFIRKEANNSILRTAGALIMPDGVLVGGEVLAVRGVEAGIIGSDIGTRTVINLVNDIEASLAYSKLVVQAELLERTIKKLKFQLGPYAEYPERINGLDEWAQRRIMPLYLRWREASEKKRFVLDMRLRMLTTAKMRSAVRVNFISRIHEGVIIKSAGQSFHVKEEFEGPGSIEFDRRTKRFSIGDIKPLPD